MKVLKRSEIRLLTGSATPATQIAVLRRHGLNPFVCGKTGRPLVTEVAVNQAMLRSVTNDFVPNMAAFD